MADYYINIFLDGEKLKKVQDAGLASQVKEDGGKKLVQVLVNDKEYKKLVKNFTFDDSNICVLPDEAETKLFNIVTDMKTLDVMKFAIMKIYNPLAGKAPRAAAKY